MIPSYFCAAQIGKPPSRDVWKSIVKSAIKVAERNSKPIIIYGSLGKPVDLSRYSRKTQLALSEVFNNGTVQRWAAKQYDISEGMLAFYARELREQHGCKVRK